MWTMYESPKSFWVLQMSARRTYRLRSSPLDAKYLRAPVAPVNSNYISFLNSQPLDVLRLIVANLSYDDITQLCGTSTKLQLLCSDQIFWKDKLIRDYSTYAPVNPPHNFDYYTWYRNVDVFRSYRELLGVQPIEIDRDIEELQVRGSYDLVYPLRPRAMNYGGSDVILAPDIHLILGAGGDRVLVKVHSRPLIAPHLPLLQQWGQPLTPMLSTLFPPMKEERQILVRVISFTQVPEFLAYARTLGYEHATRTIINVNRIPVFVDNPNENIRELLLERQDPPSSIATPEMYRPIYEEDRFGEEIPDASPDYE